MTIIDRHTYLTCCVAMMFLAISPNVVAQSEDSGKKHRPLFEDDSILMVTIEGPLSTIMRVRDDSEEFPAIFKYADADGTKHEFDILLRIRGKFRAKKSTCRFAPLRVNFKKGQVKGTMFAGQDKIKLVTDCQSSRSYFQQILLKEYLAYKILNQLTDNSFRARRLRVTYVDTDKKNKSRESYAFFIEVEEHIGDRLGLDLAKVPGITYDALNPAQSNLISVYEYFVANTDFSQIAGPDGSNCCHNIVLYQNGDEPIIPIPYDFDHAGLVDAPYASPNPAFKIRSVTQRVYRGRCANNAHLDATFQHFLANRDDIRNLVSGLEGFESKSIKKTMRFIDDFYEDISSPKDIEKFFINKCS